MASYSGSLPTIFNIYDDPKQRSSQHEQAQESCGQFYYLQAPQNAFLPFQFEMSVNETVSEIKVLFDIDGSFVYDLTANTNLLHYRDLGNGVKVCFHYGNYLDTWAGGSYLQEGRFYLQFKLTSNVSTRYKYSDTFEIPPQSQKIEITTTTKLMAFGFTDIVDFQGKTGGLYHVTGDTNNPYFLQRIYFYTTQYQFSESHEKEDTYKDGYGYEYPFFQRVIQRISFETIVPYSVYRGLSVARMCKTIQVSETERSRSGDVENLQISADAIGEGAFYKLLISFEENTIVKKPC